MGKAILEWGYNPKTFFEKDIIIENEQYLIEISEGKIILAPKKYDPKIDHKDYNNFIESHFISRMIDNRINYEIKEGAKIFEDENGRRDIHLKVETVSITATLSAKLSVTKYDKDGNIIFDSEQDEMKKKQEFLSQIQNVLDKYDVVPHLVQSYKNSIRFPNDELVYLYEIVDAIQTFFGGKSKALRVLNILNSEWSELGKICNKLPLKQGRHRGQMIGKLKDAKSEIERARILSQKIIHSFINYLNGWKAL